MTYVPPRQGRNRPRRKILARKAVTPRTSAPRIRKTHVWSQLTTLRTAFTPAIVGAVFAEIGAQACRAVTGTIGGSYCFRSTRLSWALSDAL